MSVDLRLSFLLIQRFQKWDRNLRETPKVLLTSCFLVVSSDEFWTEFHKTFRCNSISQTVPPTADMLLTSATPLSDTSPVPLLPLIRKRRAMFSPSDFLRRDAYLLNGVQHVFRWWYFLGSKLLWIPAQISPEAVGGRHFYVGLLTLDMNRFYRKIHNAAQLCFPLRPFPHT